MASIKVRFDYQMFNIQKFGGISKYFAALEGGLSKAGDIVAELKLLHSENGYLSQKHHLLPYGIGHFFFKKRSRAERWNRYYSNILLKESDFDVFHPTYYDPYFLSFLTKPFVLTVHDMIHELYPEYYYSSDDTSYCKRKVIERADHIIAISESTKRDLQRFYHVPDQKISVIYHGLFDISSTEADGHSVDPPIQASPYILYVGERSFYKNFYRFARVFARLSKRHAYVRLICAGGGMFGDNEKEHLRKLGILEKVTHVSVNDSQLKHLYEKALFFCYPSLYEGFGLPILEAFSNGCPVAVSNTSCFGEVGGDAVAYFDPYKEESMETTMLHLLESTDLRRQFAIGGSARLPLFSVEQCLASTLKVYQNLL